MPLEGTLYYSHVPRAERFACVIESSQRAGPWGRSPSFQEEEMELQKITTVKRWGWDLDPGRLTPEPTLSTPQRK